MSNQKEFQCKDPGKITFEITLQSTEGCADLLQQDSKELEKYVDDLVKCNQRNPKYLCVACWCLLTYFQKQQHSPVHQAFIRTSGQYIEKGSFEALAIHFGHFKEINQVKHFFKIKEKPNSCMQIKKGKVLQEESLVPKLEVQTPISVDLSKTSLKKDSLKQSAFENSIDIPLPQENVEKKVRLLFCQFKKLLVKKVSKTI